MKRTGILMAAVLLLLTVITISFVKKHPVTVAAAGMGDTVLYPDEHHFKNMQQLTFGGDNAEAYFSADSKYLIFQRTNPKEGIYCDRQFIGKLPAQGEKFTYTPISSGKGRTTCGFFHQRRQACYLCVYPPWSRYLSAHTRQEKIRQQIHLAHLCQL